MRDIAVTLADLTQRDLLRVEETDGAADWLLTSPHGVPARQAIAEYETRLLDQLAGRGRSALLSSLAALALTRRRAGALGMNSRSG